MIHLSKIYYFLQDRGGKTYLFMGTK